MNTTISFELAKLLKEKDEQFDVTSTLDYPTIDEVKWWLYEKHGIWISVDWMTRKKPFNSGFYCHLRGTSKPLSQDNFIVINDTLDPGYEVFNSPTEACEAAIKYCLEKII